jgi:diketogulonate reductase-like aldo/keto reductase
MKIQPQLGFGTALLLGSQSSHNAENVIAAAVSAGLNYIDTARMYGNGEAESLIGKAIKGKRHGLILASKAGILPPSRSLILRSYNKIARSINTKFSKNQRKFLPNYASDFKRGAFQPDEIKSSLAASLKRLGTDYLDVFLLHEAQAHEINSPEVLRLLEELKRAGIVRLVGVASDAAELMKFDNLPEVIDVWQMAERADRQTASFTKYKVDIITHSLANILSANERDLFFNDIELLSHIKDSFREKNARSLVMNALTVYALWKNCDGTILFSSNNRSHIVQNMLLLEDFRARREEFVDLAKKIESRIQILKAHEGMPSIVRI